MFFSSTWGIHTRIAHNLDHTKLIKLKTTEIVVFNGKKSEVNINEDRLYKIPQILAKNP
jgi:hypothetical protein